MVTKIKPISISDSMDPKIERLTESSSLGEGPHWDADKQCLYYVDIYGQNLLKYNPATKQLNKASVAPKQPSFIIPVAGTKDRFVVSLNNELTLISWDGERTKISVVETLCIVDTSPETPNNKFNDGKCDPSGRLWAGTLALVKEDTHSSPALGTLYSFNAKRQLKGHINKIRISNGLAFNEFVKKMYFIDSFERTIDQFDFDITNGTISNRQVLFTLRKHNIPGSPDGMTIDTDGNLLVAIFGGSRIIKINGTKPETLLETINMPAQQVTSMAFGGANLDELYVTTGAFPFGGQEKPEPPVNGATYKITGTGARGFSGVSFKLFD